MNCFWTIFGGGAIALWLVLAFWVGLFTALSRLALVRFNNGRGWLLVPFIWTGLEYFRSELYYLRFSWMNVGYALSNSAFLPSLKWLGMYGAGFVAMTAAVCVSLAISGISRVRWIIIASITALLAVAAVFVPYGPSKTPTNTVKVACVQMEFPSEPEIVPALDKALKAAPDAELFVLSEYTLDGQPPDTLKKWCRQNHRHLIVGGKDAAPNSNFYNTAFVIGPDGNIIFRQVKSVPIQFFKDGLPAPSQKLWNSPWGKIGICICYDLSYTRVTDQLVRLGAQALVVPTMDVAEWGAWQHQLHARVAPVRTAEYGIPIFRVASSGISQLVDRSGRVLSAAGFPGEGETIAGELHPVDRGTLPLDRWLAPSASVVTGLFIISLFFRKGGKQGRTQQTAPKGEYASAS